MRRFRAVPLAVLLATAAGVSSPAQKAEPAPPASKLQLRGRGDSDHEAAWVGELDAGQDIPFARPGRGPGDWRVTVGRR